MLRRRCATATLCAFVRCAQFERTSEMNTALNRGDKMAAVKWISKSTREFEPPKSVAAEKAAAAAAVREKSTAVSTPGSPRSEVIKAKKRDLDASVRSAEDFAQNEIDRIWDFKKGRVQKYKEFYSRHGWSFAAFYVACYLFGLAMFWSMLRTGWITKTALFEMVFSVTNGYMTREAFFSRVEEWNDYIDFGFAFTINELLDIIRIPFVLMLYFSVSRMMRPPKASIFRMHAPEK